MDQSNLNLKTASTMRGMTPLSWAANSGHEEVVKALLERKDINPDKADVCGQTPLWLAASNGHEGVLKILLERNDVNPDATDDLGQTPLSRAAESGHEGAVRIFLDRGKPSNGLTRVENEQTRPDPSPRNVQPTQPNPRKTDPGLPNEPVGSFNK